MITIKEFREHLDKVLSEYKDGDNLSYNDQMSIGVKFKQLPRKMRNWNKLVKELPVDCSGEALRKRVEKYIKRNPEVLSPAEEGEMYANDYAEQQKVRDWYNAYRRDIREEVRVENLKDEIRRAADKFSKIPLSEYVRKPYVVDDKYEGETEAVLLLSDLHIGVDCDNCYNTYNMTVAAKRLGKLAFNVIKYCHRNHVKTLHVLNLGDMIQGLIHTNARIEQQMDVSEQIMIAGEILSNFLGKIKEAAPNITYRSVYDNHSRAVADKNQHIEKEQFSRLIDWFIEERLKDSGIYFVNDNIDGGVGKFKLSNGKTIVFAHGHQDSINSSWQNFIGMTREWIDYIMLAHYHNSKEKSYNGSTVFVNGSVCGTESYAFGRRLFSDPVQKLIIFNWTNTYSDININLKEEK